MKFNPDKHFESLVIVIFFIHQFKHLNINKTALLSPQNIC